MITFAFVCASNQNRSMAAHAALLEKPIFAHLASPPTYQAQQQQQLQLQQQHHLNTSQKIATTNNNNNNNNQQPIHNLQFAVKSYGTGSQVKLPGKTQAEPNTYPFGTPYIDMYNDLKKKDEKFYIQNGLLPMLRRNANIKLAPERWHEKDRQQLNIVFTFEDRVFDAVVDSILGGYGTVPSSGSSSGVSTGGGGAVATGVAESDSVLTSSTTTTTMSSARARHGPVHVLNLNVKDNHEEAVKNAKIVADLCEEFILHTTELMSSTDRNLYGGNQSNNGHSGVGDDGDSPTDMMDDEPLPSTLMFDDWESAIDPLIRKYEKMYKKRIYHVVLFES